MTQTPSETGVGDDDYVDQDSEPTTMAPTEDRPGFEALQDDEDVTEAETAPS